MQIIVGSTMEPRECERSLQDWLTQYCIDNPQDQSWAERARKAAARRPG